jgi:cell division protease FtsH
MVTHWGMSDKLGPMSYGENQQEVFLGHSITQQKHISESTAQMIDAEVREIVDEGYTKAREIISKELHHLHDLATALLEHETLTGEEIGAILRGEPMPKPSTTSHEPSAAASGGKRGSVPSTAPPPKDAPGGMEPSPQPGA